MQEPENRATHQKVEVREMKIARFVAASKELFYFVSGLQMLRRHCESLEEAQRIVAACGFPQEVVLN
jgi:hypothetical protein